MSNAKHTPGPWIINGKSQAGYRIDAPLEGKTGLEFLQSYVAFAKTEADAKLIAAAPDLAEALKKVIERPPEGWSMEDALKVFEKCRAALAKGGVE